MNPGLGVGGYCLTKIRCFQNTQQKFAAKLYPDTKKSIEINKRMPLHSIDL